MRLKVQITVESGEGESEMIEVARPERASLRPDTLGLSLTEARSILAGLEQTIAQRQVAEFITQAQRTAQPVAGDLMGRAAGRASRKCRLRHSRTVVLVHGRERKLPSALLKTTARAKKRILP
jgi:hypothetical protein